MDTSHFSDHLQQAVSLAEEAAKHYHTNYIGTEHVLLAMMCVTDSTASRLLIASGASIEKYREGFRRHLDHNLPVYGFTPRAKRAFDLAREFALNESDRLDAITGTEHVLLAILADEGGIGIQLLSGIGVDPDEVVRRTEEFIGPLHEEDEVDRSVQSPRQPSDEGAALSAGLLAYGVDLTRRAREGKIDPVIGRRKEIEKVIQILSRRSKNNPVLIGEPGVGKSAVVEGLAQAIVSGNVPELLRNKTVFSLDLSGLVAGTRYRGDFEERLKNIVDEVTSNRDIILFIDEIHMIVGAGGSSDNTMDASNILKPMLARGELQTVGATTLEEYRKYIEKDAALERRFTPVTVSEPSIEDTIAILRGIKDKYEAHHNVVITDAAIEAAVRLSDRYITDRFLPDKAIDLIDEAASKGFRILEASIVLSEEPPAPTIM